ncbi:lipid droplet-associated protein [Streptomyces gardneri]|uniref:lipid droplet-associated protein n=1 Tax=Nocardia TaxID=1817 RepID=UPI00135AE98E|nr:MULTISPECIES: lipid droplet-associated protein [Nocardia]MBF6166771.1 lipid droplet-associated protein [Streptomyces gardneri]MBF6205302.1 lipid droplet-associated protein [Streptomyces gardneri]
MFRPPFLARVAAGAAVYALEESRRLPTAAMNLPITAISQMLQTTMHVQQFVTSLALKGDAVFDRLANRPVEQPEWATFEEDLADEPSPAPLRSSRFDLYTADDPEPFRSPESFPADDARAGETNGHAAAPTIAEQPAEEPEPTDPESELDPVAEAPRITEPEVAIRYDYATMTLAQLRARLRLLTVEDLTALLEYEQHTRARAPFVTMLTNRIATVQAQ